MILETSNPFPERSSKRVHVALPLRITYWNGENKPCPDLACTYDISSQGARITGLRSVKMAGEIIAIERGRNKAFCRVVWVGQSNSELHGQIGIQCIETDRTIWDAELRDLDEAYDLIPRDSALARNSSVGSHDRNRRRHERFAIDGLVELHQPGSRAAQNRARLKDLSELGCLLRTEHLLSPGTEIKLVLNVSDYDLRLKGEVRHAGPDLGLGVEFREARKGDRQMLQFLLRKLAERQLEDVFELEVHS